MYDREISPYGYPTNQSILIREGMSDVSIQSSCKSERLKVK